MSKSPYIPEDVKKYMEQFKIEEVINEAVNTTLQARPADPFSAFAQYFGKLSSPIITIENVNGIEILNSDLKPTIQLRFKVQCKGSSVKYQPSIHFSQSYIEQEIFYDDEQKNMKNAIQAINNISTSLSSKNIKDQKNIDETLLKYLNENPTHINVIQSISYSLIPMYATLMNTSLSKQLSQALNKIELTIPSLYINLFQGSKIVQSKCKVYRFLLIGKDDEESMHKIMAVTQNVRKAIVSGKKGEAALQFYIDGTFICPADTVIDNLKMIEQAIEAAQAKEQVSVGLVWLSETFYMADDKKYDLDNPKKLLDADQMIDYYFKLCNDKPIISYLEDPLHFTDFVGWNKMITKFKDHRVKLGSRRLYDNLEKLKKHCEIVTAETNPDLSEQQLQQLNNEKINLEFIQKPLYSFNTFFEYQCYVQYLNQKKPETKLILSDSLYDTEDTYIVDIAFSTTNARLCLGPPIKYEKIIKFNKFMRISNELK